MEVTVTLEEASKGYDAYTVMAGKHRILTVATCSQLTVTKWLAQVLKCSHKRNIVVGVSASVWKPRFEKQGLKDSRFDLLQICTGSHCLIYHLPEYGTPKALKEFFADRRVTAVGIGMASVAKKLEENHDITVANAVDLKDAVVVDLMKTLKSGKIGWFNHSPTNFWKLSEEKVKYATLDTYVCFSMGYELVKKKK